MKILFQNRPDSFDISGGDTVQMKKTIEYLAPYGVEGDIDCSISPKNLDKYDLVHVFNINMIHPTYFQIMNAKKQGKPVVLSTIYNPNLREWDKKGRYGKSKLFFKHSSENTKERAKCAARLIKPGSHNRRSLAHQLIVGYKKQVVGSLRAADLLLPNSQMELETVERVFGVVRPYRVIPNGVETIFADAPRGAFEKEYGIKDYVLCVANLYSVKNQITLCRAMASHPEIPVVFIGKKSSNHISYYNKIMDFIKNQPQMKVIDFIPHEQLRHAYADARVHVLPSWTETTGLSTLEAGLAGCKIVTTDRGYTREYFQDFAWYCDPADTESVRRATIEAYNAPAKPGLRERILENYTWQKTAETTFAAYQDLLGGKL